MPKKRNTSWSRSKKEKQILTARLIEISLKVEDCIYKHKLISAWEAEQYIREVSSYIEQCSQDERSLQVIEKLTRCMRAIILDQQESSLRTENHSSNNVRSMPGGGVHATSISPVYSIPDEDRTQFTQIAEEANNNVEIIDISNIDDDDDSMHNGTNTATANYAGSRVTVAVDVHRGMSSLSLRDVEEPLDNMAISAEANCSQSILKNFEGVQMQQNEINITPQTAVAGGLVGNVTGSRTLTNVMQAVSNSSIQKIPYRKITPMIEPNKTVKTAIALNKPIINCNTENNLKFNTVVQNKEPLKLTNTARYGLTNYFNQKDNTITPQTFYTATNNIPENQRQAWYDSNRTCTITDSSRSLTDAKRFTQPRQIYKDVLEVNQCTFTKAGTWNDIQTNTFNTVEKDKQTITTENSRAPLQNKRRITNAAVAQEKTITTKKKRGPKKNLTGDKEIKPKNKRVNGNPKRNKENTFSYMNKNKTIPIYNENVIDDLSWIENIRYVRDIRNDENDPKLSLEESFWDNYYLPANWSENEFV